MTDEMKFYNFGGQINYAKDNSTINAWQKNDLKNESIADIDKIIRLIEEDLHNLKNEDAAAIGETLTMIKEEISKPHPKESGIKRCITLLAPMFTIVNGIPALLNNLQTLIAYLQGLPLQ